MSKLLDLIEKILAEKSYASQIMHQIITCPCNTKLITQGELHPDFYIIKEGKVRIKLSGHIHTESEAKKVHPGVATLEKGNIFGEFSLFEEIPASADVVSASEAVLIQIDSKSFSSFLNAHPELGYRFLSVLYKNFVDRIQSTNKALLNILEWGLKAYQIDKHL